MPAGSLSGQTLFPHFDKLAHFGLYLVLAILLWRPLQPYFRQSPLIVILVITVSLGVLVEFLQHWLTSDRYGSVGDVLANAAGSLLGLQIWSRLPIGTRWLRWI